jgi:hypothetical protein
MDPLILEGLLFSGIDLALVGLAIWFFFFSPLKKRPGTTGQRISRRLSAVLALLLLLSGFQFFIGAMWDTSMHIKTGEIPGGADFLWPPHIMIYSGFVITLGIALFGLAHIALPAIRRGERDPRLWLRSNPYLAVLSIASLYALASVPGDAIWHELFGIDLTAWSPPHLLLGLATSSTLFCGAGLLAQAYSGFTRPRWVTPVLVLLFGLMLNIGYFIAGVEWETPGPRSPLVAARPEWLYPLVTGVWLFLVLYWAKRAARWRWTAAAVALAFFVFRLVGEGVIALTDNIPLGFPLIFFGGAVLMDLVPLAGFAAPFRRDLLLAAAFSAGFAALTSIQIALRPDLSFTPADYWIAFGLVLVINTALVHLGRVAADRMFMDGSPTQGEAIAPINA